MPGSFTNVLKPKLGESLEEMHPLKVIRPLTHSPIPEPRTAARSADGCPAAARHWNRFRVVEGARRYCWRALQAKLEKAKLYAEARTTDLRDKHLKRIQHTEVRGPAEICLACEIYI